MVYLRDGRDTFTFQGRSRTGWTQVGTGVTDKGLALKIEHMWNHELGEKERAWDVLDRVRPLRKQAAPGTLTVLELYDLWIESRRNVAALRRRLNDVDIEPLVLQWATWLHTQSGADWAKHALLYVRRLVPADTPLLASSVTDTWLTAELAKIPLARNTLRKVHASWSSFFGYLTRVHRVFEHNPMYGVWRGEREKTPPVFYDQATAERIVTAQPDEKKRAFFALMYGTGADVSPAVRLCREDVNPAEQEVRIAGTKSVTRDRVVRLADWAWPYFWSYARTVAYGQLFTGFSRWTVSDWHRKTVVELKLPRRLFLRYARHHFAVRLLQAGAPIKVVSEQLGSDEKTVLDYYGPWITSAADRARWEKAATKHETARRKAR